MGHQDAVLVARRLALGPVGDDHGPSGSAVGDLPPLAPDREARATATKHATGLDLLDQVPGGMPDRQPAEPGQVLVEPLGAAVERRTGQQPRGRPACVINGFLRLLSDPGQPSAGRARVRDRAPADRSRAVPYPLRPGESKRFPGVGVRDAQPGTAERGVSVGIPPPGPMVGGPVARRRALKRRSEARDGSDFLLMARTSFPSPDANIVVCTDGYFDVYPPTERSNGDRPAYRGQLAGARHRHSRSRRPARGAPRLGGACLRGRGLVRGSWRGGHSWRAGTRPRRQPAGGVGRVRAGLLEGLARREPPHEVGVPGQPALVADRPEARPGEPPRPPARASRPASAASRRRSPARDRPRHAATRARSAGGRGLPPAARRGGEERGGREGAGGDGAPVPSRT